MAFDEQKLEATRANLKDIHEATTKKTKLTLPVIESSRRLGRSFTAYGDHLVSTSPSDTELGAFCSLRT